MATAEDNVFNTSTDEEKPSGAESDTVRLVSADGKVFTVKREAAMCSGTIKNMLSSEAYFMESTNNEISFPEIKSEILQQVCEYLEYKHKYSNHTENIPEFHIDVENALELLMAADYLDSKWWWWW
ncbi:RNA polymerase II transcription elongation factor [Syncephalis pseudoplumigaleata]|uniref:Elongin-C n=1 Tax=Syncephalis pseudoplumigaleata TaxID=1712513 RepID=A0A4P9YZB8_9FUNG|nr:RNA polymerase II transcription elongation factor [Syncephalis pseudoplumigaleata]|eukprot:RKP25523.1 RNA polymerase II transcription elongation factor [Syncephalis pseudoplumigaleata]